MHALTLLPSSDAVLKVALDRLHPLAKWMLRPCSAGASAAGHKFSTIFYGQVPPRQSPWADTKACVSHLLVATSADDNHKQSHGCCASLKCSNSLLAQPLLAREGEGTLRASPQEPEHHSAYRRNPDCAAVAVADTSSSLRLLQASPPSRGVLVSCGCWRGCRRTAAPW